VRNACQIQFEIKNLKGRNKDSTYSIQLSFLLFHNFTHVLEEFKTRLASQTCNTAISPMVFTDHPMGAPNMVHHDIRHYFRPFRKLGLLLEISRIDNTTK